jgi:hypothetical protein
MRQTPGVERLIDDDPEVVALPIAADGTVEVDDLGGQRFVAVVAAVDADEVLGLLTALREHLAEVIFTSDPARPWGGEQEAAMVALERGWLGQDFVFSVPELVPAVRYARDALRRERDRWEGSGVLVVAGAAGIDAVRADLS